MFSGIVTVFHLVISLLSIIYVNKGLKKFNSPLYKNKDILEKYKPFRRTDRDNWNKYEMYICSVLLCPFRLLLSFAIIIFFILTMCIATFGKFAF